MRRSCEGWSITYRVGGISSCRSWRLFSTARASSALDKPGSPHALTHTSLDESARRFSPMRVALRPFFIYRYQTHRFGCVHLVSSMSRATCSTVCVVRAYSPPLAYAQEESANTDEDDYLQAYEELMLHAASNAETDARSVFRDAGSETVSSHCGESSVHEGGAVPCDETCASGLPPADALVEETLAALPADGTAVLLTTLTRSLDVEAVSELFGSVRSFLRLYPHCFTCTQDTKSGRWHVARSRLSTLPLSTVAAAATPSFGSPSSAQDGARDDPRDTIVGLDVVAMMLNEELTLVCGAHHPPSQISQTKGEPLLITKKQSRCNSTPFMAPHPPTSSPKTESTHSGALSATEHAWWSTIASLLPEDGTPMAISVLRASLPGSILQSLRNSGVGLARSFKGNYAMASLYVALTADATALARAAVPRLKGSVVTPLAFWSPSPQAAATMHGNKLSVNAPSSGAPGLGEGVYVHPPADYDASRDAEPWMVALSLDEGDLAGPEGELREAGDASEEALILSVDHAAALEASTGLQEIPYTGLRDASGQAEKQSRGTALQPKDLDVERLRDAPLPPAAPSKATPPASTALSASTVLERKVRPPRPSTPAEWLALHTAMAEARGWITPMQMLEYLVECVPTFFIPLEELRPSTAILKLVGARTSMRTLVCRIYVYFMERSAGNAQIRLSPTVEHRQRGIANEHYAAWDPARTSEREHRSVGVTSSMVLTTDSAPGTSTNTAAECGDLHGSPVRSGVRGGGAVLQCSDATKAFPVLRVQKPIKSVLSVDACKTSLGTARKAAPAVLLSSVMRSVCPEGGAGPTRGVSESSAPAILHRQDGIIALSSVPTGEMGYPFLALATQPAETWPWWARLLCVLPFDTYVPLDHLSVFYCPDLLPENVHLAWRATEASFSRTASGDKMRTPIPFSLLRAPTKHRKVRLRPFWLSPGCTAELEDSVMPSGLLTQLRPTWLPVSRVLAKLTPEEREASFAFALRRPSAVALSAEEALVMLWRDCGYCCWVQDDGAKVRRYTACGALDDHFHFSLSLLYGFSSARVLEPLSVVLDRASEHVRVFFQQVRAQAPVSPDTVGLIGMLRHAPPGMLREFLTRHAQWLEIEVAAGTEARDKAAVPLLVRRRASLVSF